MTDLEVELLAEAVARHYGWDFRNYARASLRRRMLALVQEEGLANISSLQALVLHDAQAFERFRLGLTVHVTAMFRDPAYYVALRETVLPWLRTHPFVRLWVAGCASGEEAYSLAILLEEAKIYDRCRIYATDLSEAMLDVARTGIFPLAAMKGYSENYQKAKGLGDFSSYYTADATHALLRPALRRNMVFAHHSLVSDGVFNEFHMISCRNVMIYFDQTLQVRVHGLFRNSLVPRGALALGSKEALRFSPHEDDYEDWVGAQRIYRLRVGQVDTQT